ncbi:recombination regulator RecX [Lonepinella sp. MS14437]|uniref:recombination regulator RecX n=1 Tax=Lonepinella sp. MS14437 TaxID=3003620 RepID=UPI0036DA044A
MSSLALNYLINLLARRDYSEYEIRCKMQQKAFSQEDIDQALAHCQQHHWQSDQRFAENYLNFRANRGYGVNRIKQELRQLKGVSSQIIQNVIEQSEINWSDIALSVLNRKFPQYQNKLDLKTKQKIWRYMLSHGFYAEEFADYIGSSSDSDY